MERKNKQVHISHIVITETQGTLSVQISSYPPPTCLPILEHSKLQDMQQLEDPALRKERPVHISRTYNLHPCAVPVNSKFMLGIIMVSGLMNAYAILRS